jgi:zinc transporter ZupT
MSVLLLILIFAAAGATLYILVKGVVNMAQQKDITGQRSQQLMRQRVLLQAAAVAVAVLLLMMASGKH